MWHKFLLFSAGCYLRHQVRRKPCRPLSRLDPQKVRHVLILHATGLGDLLLSTPALRALRETYPHWTLDLLVSPPFADLVRHHPGIRRLWLYPGRGPGLFRLGRDLRRQGYDLAIILHGNDPEATLLAHLSGAPFIIGSAGSPLAFVYSTAVPRSQPLEHATEHRLNYVRLLGADTRDKRMELFLPQEAEVRAEDILKQHFGASASRLMALHPTGSGAYKWWPLENFVALGAFLYERYQAPLLIISGHKDRPVAEALAARLPGPSLVTGGRHSLITVAGMLKRARLLVANDSGPLHMALALGVPSLALIGADHPARIGPYQVDWGTYLYKKDEVCREEPCLNRKCTDNRCMQAIGVQDAVRTIESWWEPRVGTKFMD